MGTPPTVGGGDQDIVTVDGLDVTINPNGEVGLPNLGPAVTWGSAYYSCVDNGTVYELTGCWNEFVSDRYPYVSQNGYVWMDEGIVKIEGNRLAADVNGCL